MQKHCLFFLFVLLLAACNSPNKKSAAYEKGTVTEAGKTSADGDGPNTKGFWQALVSKELRDNNGTVLAIMPIPSNWEFHDRHAQGEPTITGPNGIKVTDYPPKSFMDNYNPGLQNSYVQSGQQLRSMPGVEDLIQQDFVPTMNSRGYQLVRYYEIPEVTKMDKWYNDQLYKAMPSRIDIAAIGTEWKGQDGSPYFLLIHLNVSTSDAMQTWYYMCTGLEADAEYFEAAKKQLVFSLGNMRYNLQPIMAYNQQEAQRVGQSWAAHNQRMAQNQAAFEASQREHINRTNAINDAIMSGWRERNAASDRSQEQFVDRIYERTNVIDPTTGQGYKVQEGANQYWMNNDGQYIGTNLHGYNPNLDDNMNEMKWRELQEVKR